MVTGKVVISAARLKIDTDVTVDEDVDHGGAHRGGLGRASLI
jgi:hypothetical protein